MRDFPPDPDDNAQTCGYCGEDVDPSVEGDALAEVANSKTGERLLVHSEPCASDIGAYPDNENNDWRLA